MARSRHRSEDLESVLWDATRAEQLQVDHERSREVSRHRSGHLQLILWDAARTNQLQLDFRPRSSLYFVFGDGILVDEGNLA